MRKALNDLWQKAGRKRPSAVPTDLALPEGCGVFVDFGAAFLKSTHGHRGTIARKAPRCRLFALEQVEILETKPFSRSPSSR